MKNLLKLMGVIGALGLCLGNAGAQETNELEQLRKEMREMRKHMEELEGKLQKYEAKSEQAAAPVDAAKQQEADAERKKLEAQLAAELATNQPPAVAQATPTPEASKPWSPTDPIRVGRGGTYADLGLVATFAAGGSTAKDIEGGTQLGGHDPNQNGFTVQGVEMNLQGAIDPYFRGNANIAFLLDSSGETGVELEEAWLETVSLPWNLQVRGGQMLTDFGRINTQHPHSWAFVDEPLVNGRFLGEDGLRNPGVRVSWLAPTPFYSELFFEIQNSQGETASSFLGEQMTIQSVTPIPGGGNAINPFLRRVNSMDDLLYTLRYAASFDLNDVQTVVAGASAAFGPNQTGEDRSTQIYGADLYWKWKPANAHAGFPFVSWQTEAMVRSYDVAPMAIITDSGNAIPAGPSGTYNDWGFYSQVAWGFKRGWVAALRGDYVAPINRHDEADIPVVGLDRFTRWRISPNLTWYPSEFSKLRLQYNYDDRDGFGVDHSIWFQFEFLLGAHAAHKF